VGHALRVEGDECSHRGAELIIGRLGKVMAISWHIWPSVCTSRTLISIDYIVRYAILSGENFLNGSLAEYWPISSRIKEITLIDNLWKRNH
jgi:hypothetical protein